MANLTPVAAFVAGTVSFLSPCVLPLVPGYISLISGATLEELQQSTLERKRLMRMVMMNSVAFIIGFSLVFILLGAVATKLGQLTRSYHSILTVVAGAVIVIFGLHLVGLLKIRFLYADKRMHSLKSDPNLWGSFLVGFAFAFGWTPCIGPILAAILAVAASEQTVARGALLLAVYSLGLGIPFIVAAFAIEPFAAFLARFKKYLRRVEQAMGALLVLTGIAFLTGGISQLSIWLLEVFPALGKIG